MTALPEHNIIISPIGFMDPVLVRVICNGVSRAFGCGTDVFPLLDDVKFSFDPGRGQYHSTVILGKLEKNAPFKASKVAAIADVDLFIPILTYVYGEAQLNGRCCIVSTHRLMDRLPQDSIIREGYHLRVVKEVIHELGHTFGLKHCPDQTCIMHYCRNVDDVDRKSDQLCRYCSVLLADSMEKMKELSY